jgi:multicomponent Na+:H+ antiporter subunit F
MDTIINISLLASFTMLLAALGLTFLRLVKGPTTNDRIVAMDLIASITMGSILVYSVYIDKTIYFDVAIILSLISFMGTVAISTYISKKK